MGLLAKAFVLSLFTVSCFTAVFSEETESLAPRYHGRYLHPAMAPSHPPSHNQHHQPPTPEPSHHHHPPTPEPSHHHHPPTPTPSHHHHHGHPPSHAPVHPPSHAPVHTPLHPPAHAPLHPPAHAPLHPPPHAPLHPPPHAPAHPPPHAPAHPPPMHPPVHPPSYHFPRSFIAVQGVVYCKSCKYSGVETLLGASPVPGATVKLQCNNTRYPIVVQAKTDKNGYFYLEAPKTITNYGAHKCKAFLVSAPTTACSKITDLHGGLNGAILRPEKPFVVNKLPFVLYSVGPFAFEPKCPR